jgi:hypothetical protein
MYGKLFAQMYDGTLGTKGPWQALVTFQQMIILADESGTVDMTREALSRRTTIPLEIIAAGIDALEEPDSASRSPDEEGRRIVRLSDDRDWGWRIVNYAHYRKIRSEIERREYHRQYAKKRRAKAASQPDVNMSTASQQNQPIEEVEAKAVSSISSSSSSREDLLAVVPNRKAWEAEMDAALQGMHGPLLTPAQLEQAIRDYLGNGAADAPNMAHFRAYLRRSATGDRTGNLPARRGGKTVAQRTFENGLRAFQEEP